MRNITISITLTVFLAISAGSNANAEQDKSAIQIYLPREITINSDSPNLGDVAIIRGNESLAAKAGKVTLGHFSSPGQKITVDRSIVLSRLACSGIPGSEVSLSGAEEITVSKQHQIIRGNEFVEKAVTFLTENPPNPSVCQYNAIRIPQDLILSDTSGDIKLTPSLAENNIKNQAKILVTAFSGDKEVGTREVMFLLKYNCRRAAAKIDMPAGTIISSENVKVEKAVSNYPEPADWAVPYGFVTRRPLPANTVISMDMVEPVKPQVILKRNQNVIIKVDRLGLLVTAIGRTMQEGRVGEYIKVQNLSSQRIILVKVNEDESVEPVF